MERRHAVITLGLIKYARSVFEVGCRAVKDEL